MAIIELFWGNILEIYGFRQVLFVIGKSQYLFLFLYLISCLIGNYVCIKNQICKKAIKVNEKM